MTKQFKIKYIQRSKIKTKIVSEEQLADYSKNIISIKPIKHNILSYKTTLKKYEVKEIFANLLIMLEANIPFIDSIELLISNENKPQVKALLHCMQKTLQKGELFKENLQEYQSVIGILPLIFLDIGQRNGDMNKAIQILVRVLEDQENNKQRILKVLQYPMILLISLLISISIIFVYLIPQFEPLFSQFGNDLPIQTKILLQTKDFFANYSLYIIASIIIMATLCIYFFKKNESFRKRWYEFAIYKIPFISKLYTWYQLYIVFSVLQMLLQQNSTLLQAITQTSLIIKNPHLKQIFSTIQSDVARGVFVHEAFQKHKIFDPIVLKLVLVGHSSDQFDLIFGKIVVLYQKHYDTRVEQFIKLVEPVFLFLMALFIIWIMLAIFIPLWDMGKVL